MMIAHPQAWPRGYSIGPHDHRRSRCLRQRRLLLRRPGGDQGRRAARRFDLRRRAGHAGVRRDQVALWGRFCSARVERRLRGSRRLRQRAVQRRRRARAAASSRQAGERVRRQVAPRLAGRTVGSFRSDVELVDELATEVPGFGIAASYGLSQSLLDAAAHAAGTTMAELIQMEWRLSGSLAAVPVFAQSGEDRRTNVDKMILRRVESLPHGLINNRSLVGDNGETLVDLRPLGPRACRGAALIRCVHADSSFRYVRNDWHGSAMATSRALPRFCCRWRRRRDLLRCALSIPWMPVRAPDK